MMDQAHSAIDTYVVAAVDPTLSVASGTSTYVLALLEYLRETPFRGIGLGLAPGNCSAVSPALTESWRAVARHSGWAGVQYWRGLSSYVRSHKDQLATSLVHAQRPDYLWHFQRHVQPSPPMVCTLHGAHLHAVRSKWGRAGGWLYERVQQAALRETHRVIAVSRDTETFFLNLYPWLEGRTQTIPVGVDTHLFRPRDSEEARASLRLPPEARIILFVGRLDEVKGLPLLLEAMRMLAAAREDIGLWIVGHGPDEQALRRRAHELGLAGRCHFVGRAERQTVAEYMNAADVLVLQSAWEGMPTVVLEALASGLPCVSTGVGDVPEVVIDGKTGYVIEPEPQAIADGIEKVLARPRRGWIEPCTAVGRQFGWPAIGKRIAEVYCQTTGLAVPSRS
jgi:glycosyltransferase involved in cell wall biosynthesis